MRDSSGGGRVSLSLLNASGGPNRQVRIWLLAAVAQRQHVTYYRVAGRLLASGQTWEVQRRFSEFLALRDTLLVFFGDAHTTCPGCANFRHSIETFAFPKKKWFGSASTKTVQARIASLRAFMNLLASWTFSTAPKCPTCGGGAFRLVRNFVVDGAHPVGGSDMATIRHSFVASSFVEGSFPAAHAARASMPHGMSPASLRPPTFLRSQSSDDVIGPRTSWTSLPPRRNSDQADWNAVDYDDLHEFLGPNEAAKPAASASMSTPQRGGIMQHQHQHHRTIPSNDRRLPPQRLSSPDAVAGAVHPHPHPRRGIVSSDEHNAVERCRSDTNVLASHVPEKPHRPSLQTMTPSDAKPARKADNAARRRANVSDRDQNRVLDAFEEPEPSDTSSDDDDEELEFTGVVTGSPHAAPRRPKTASGEGLWQPWELVH